MFDIHTATLIIVGSMILLMMVGIPLGIVTLTVSIGTALAYFGLPGLFLVASNAQGLLEAYPLVAVPLFVSDGESILERSPGSPKICSTPCRFSPATSVAWRRCRPDRRSLPFFMAAMSGDHGRRNRHAGSDRPAADAAAWL